MLSVFKSLRFGTALLAVVTMFVLGCSSGPRIITNSDPNADWAGFRTFGYFNPLDTDRGNVRSLMSNQLIEATNREMQAAGFTLDETDPDLLINFFVTTRETLRTRPSTSAGVRHGRGRYGTWSGWSMSASTTEVVQQTEGTLGIDIVDRRSNTLVWEGAASKRVTNSTRQNQAEVLDSAVADIFARFP